jgi:hypothetical protein
MMATTRILFLVNGLGLGNSTRCHAVIQRLLDYGAEIQVVTSGNGLWYFKSVPTIAKLHEVESLYYGVKDGRISIARTLRAVSDFVAILRRNARKIDTILSDWRPDVGNTNGPSTTGRGRRSRGILPCALGCRLKSTRDERIGGGWVGRLIPKSTPTFIGNR